ncbi:hypothetical protein [Halobaculum sp. EA56]|uniref:hypothetical protein n=1 Tax=Halobaculum sp. EA56 TaxID=3421648 RepID=UPI003EBEC0BC
MTHTTTVEERVSDGSFESVFATLDVTGLDAADSESFDPAAELGFDTVLGVSVEGLENGDLYQAAFDHLDGATLHVHNLDGTDPTAGTDVGEVRVKVSGDPSA